MLPFSIGRQGNSPISSCYGKIVGFSDGFYRVETTYGTYDRVPSICGRCSINDRVLIKFGDEKNKRHPLIIYNSSRILTDSGDHVAVIILSSGPGLWSQSLSSAGLNPLALDCFRPDPNASTLTVWSGTGGHYNDFPVLLDKDARPVLCFAERRFDNTNWDVVRTVVLVDAMGQAIYTCNWTGPNVLFVPGFNACNGDSSIIYLSEVSSRKSWRKRGESGAVPLDLLREITLSGLNSNHTHDTSNMSDASILIFPRYYRTLSGEVRYPEGMPSTGTPNVILNVEAVNIEAYNLDVPDEVLPKITINPATFFTYANPAVSAFSGSHAFDGQGRLLAWASARDSFDAASGSMFDKSASVGWLRNGYSQPRPPSGDFIYPNFSHQWGRKIAGVLACLNSGGTGILWRHAIEKIAGTPLSNDQLIAPFDAVFSDQHLDNEYTDANASSAIAWPAVPGLRSVAFEPYSPINYGGIVAQGALLSSRENIAGQEFGAEIYFGPFYQYGIIGSGPTATGFHTSYGSFPLPRYDHYNAVNIELLPRGRNFAKATRHPDDFFKWLNWDVFSSWAGPTSQTGSSVVCKRPQNDSYICFTVPRSCFFGGFCTFQGAVSSAGAAAPYVFAKRDRPSWVSRYKVFRTPENGGDYVQSITPLSHPVWSTIGAAGYGLGYADAFIDSDLVAVTGHYVRGLSYVSQRFLRKIDSSGALVWEKDMTQLVAGASVWKTRTELGVRPPGATLVGATSTEELPLGDDMGPARPAGRVIFLPCDYHELGPNYLPTQRLLILDDSNGDLLHTLPLIDVEDELDPGEVLAEDVREAGEPITASDSGLGDGATVEFALSQTAQSINYAEVDGILVEGVTLSGDGNSVIFPDPPGDGISWYVEYVIGTTEGDLIWEAGEKRFDAIVKEIHCGVDPVSKEWALVKVAINDRLPGEDNRTGDKTMRLKLGESISTAPDVDWIFGTISLREAIHGGSIYKLGSNGAGTANSILRKTNPSTV